MKKTKWIAVLTAAVLAVTSITPFTVFQSEAATAQADGNANGEGSADILDLIRVKKYVDQKDGTVLADKADADGNNKIDSGDVKAIREYLAGGTIKSFWADSNNMQVDLAEDGTNELNTTSEVAGATYMYLEGQSTDIYLSADYATNAENCQFAGITIRQGDQTRQVGFQNTGITVHSQHGWSPSNGTGVPDAGTNVFYYNTAGDGNDYVWAQNTAAAYGPEAQSIVTTFRTVPGTYNVKWVIAEGTLYASIKDIPVLHIPLTKLCADWTADKEYQIGFNQWDANANGKIKVTNVDVRFGEEALVKVVLDKTVAFSKNVNVSYDALTGTYLPKTAGGSARVYGEAWTGTQSVSTTIKLIDVNNNGSAAGITVCVLGDTSEEVASRQILAAKGAENVRIQENYSWGTPTYTTLLNGATGYDASGALKMTAIITAGTLNIYYGETLAYQATLADLFGDAYTDGANVQLGLCSWDANNGLMMFEDTQFNTWGDASSMQVVGGESGAEVNMTAFTAYNAHMYLGEASNNIYLAADYNVSAVDGENAITTKEFGITIKQGDQSRQVTFQHQGVELQAQHDWTIDKGTNVPEGVARFSYNTAGDGNPYIIRQSTVTAYGITAKSLIADMTSSTVAATYHIEWVITGGVLYASIDNAPVLKLPLTQLCTTWTEDLAYQVGFDSWDASSLNCEVTMTDIEAYFGDEATAAFKKQVAFAETSGMTYNPLGGYVPDFGSKYAYGTATTGEQGISTTITLADTTNTGSGNGITVKSGSQSAQIYVGGYSRTIRMQINHTWGTPMEVTSQVPADITPYDENGVCEMSAIIKDGKLYVFFNGAQAGSIELYKLLPGYTTTSTVQLGIATWDTTLGLAAFDDITFLTADEVDAIETTYVAWDVEFLLKSNSNATVDAVNGTITQTISTAATTHFHGTSTTWEINGSMNRLDALTSQMAQGFRITVGDTTARFLGQHKGLLIPWNYNYNGGNNALAFNPTIVKYFGDNRTTDTIAFKAIIANDTLYVWFDGVPSWQIPLTSAIYSTDGNNTELFAGFAAGSAYNLGVEQVYANESQGSIDNLTVKTGDAVDMSQILVFPDAYHPSVVDFIAYARQLGQGYDAQGQRNITVGNNTTVFMGDSFFDGRQFWTDFYQDYEGKDVFLAGIGSTTTTNWTYLIDEVFASFDKAGTAPKNIAMHLGTNNLWSDTTTADDVESGLKNVFAILHQKYPNTKIYFFGITHRANGSAADRINAVNTAMADWCPTSGYVTYIDTPSIITSDMLWASDGLHPNLDTYNSVFMVELEEADCVIESK